MPFLKKLRVGIRQSIFNRRREDRGIRQRKKKKFLPFDSGFMTGDLSKINMRRVALTTQQKHKISAVADIRESDTAGLQVFKNTINSIPVFAIELNVKGNVKLKLVKEESKLYLYLRKNFGRST